MCCIIQVEVAFLLNFFFLHFNLMFIIKSLNGKKNSYFTLCIIEKFKILSFVLLGLS